jgi:catechol 2,3-dioxygenase-like lactoylglutathione lyase family enzyme
MISHLQVVTVYVRNLDQALNFYTKKLGFTLSEDWRDEHSDDRMLFLAPEGAKETLLGLYAPPAGDPRIGTSTGIVFTAKDIRTTYQELKSKGVPFTSELITLPYGKVSATWKPNSLTLTEILFCSTLKKEPICQKLNFYPKAIPAAATSPSPKPPTAGPSSSFTPGGA